MLSKTHKLDALAVTARVAPAHADDDRAPRADGYWEAYIVPARGATAMEVTVDVTPVLARRAPRTRRRFARWTPRGSRCGT